MAEGNQYVAGISVVICCFNSVTRLAPTLEHLIAQRSPGTMPWEVILVDNNSTDGTSVFALSYWEKNKKVSSPPLRVIKESRSGVAFARECGIMHAKYDYVLFCDDDNWLHNSYLLRAQTHIGHLNMNTLGAIAGVGAPVFENEQPPHFFENQYSFLAIGEHDVHEGDITNTKRVAYSAGMILSKLAFIKLKEQFAFNFHVLSRIGNSLESSEDYELCLALGMAGYKIYWYKDLQFQHYMPSRRTTISYYCKLFKGIGRSQPLLIGYHLFPTNPINIKNDYRYIIFRNIKNVLISYLKLWIKGYFWSKDKYDYIDKLYVLYTNIGNLQSTIRVKNKIRDKFIMSPLFLNFQLLCAKK